MLSKLKSYFVTEPISDEELADEIVRQSGSRDLKEDWLSFLEQDRKGNRSWLYDMDAMQKVNLARGAIRRSRKMRKIVSDKEIADEIERRDIEGDLSWSFSSVEEKQAKVLSRLFGKKDPFERFLALRKNLTKAAF